RRFSGAVHIKWYGVADATSSACLANMANCNSATALQAAFTAAALFGDGGVKTDQRSIAFRNADITIPDHGYLDCGGPPGGAKKQTGNAANYYWLNKASIIHGTEHTLIQAGNSPILN